MDDKDSISDVNGEDDGVLGALSGRGPQANGVHGAFSFTPGNLGFGHTGKTSSGKDAHMAYLMLRHLKLRHIRRSVSTEIVISNTLVYIAHIVIREKWKCVGRFEFNMGCSKIGNMQRTLYCKKIHARKYLQENTCKFVVQRLFN